MNHEYVSLVPGTGSSLPCARCARSYASHEPRLLDPRTRIEHSELLRRIGRCDGRCGQHRAEPFSHNDQLHLFGRCDGSCGQHR